MVNRRASIYIAYTGGTIGMMKTPEGYRPKAGYLQRLIGQIPAFKSTEVPHYHIEEFNPLLDSSNMTPAEWVRVAQSIRENYTDYDGFLVLHGTDTMSFTASALSFMLEDLSKPIILTGSQIPLAETRNDAQENLLTSLLILGRYHRQLPGVFLYFNNKLFRGNRTTKINADEFAAFASPNLPPVCQVGIDMEFNWDLVLKPARKTGGVSVVEIGDATVASFRLFPGLKAEYLKNLLAVPVQGVVLECFGAGNAPSRNQAFMEALTTATRRGVVIVDVTQPLYGSANLELYATGQALLQAGVVSGHDMTTEAALAKLFYLFAKGYPPEEIRRLVQKNLCGELTPPEELPGDTEKLRERLASFL